MPPKRKRTDDKNQFSAAATATNDYDDDDIRSLLISLNEKVQEMKNEQKEIREEMKQAFVHRSETKEEFKEMRERMNAIKDTVERIDSVVSPSPLWKFVTDHPDVFEKHVLLSGYLNETDIKMFYGSCRASRSAVKRAKIELRKRFRVRELSSISTMELAWEGFPWGARVHLPGGNVHQAGGKFR
jgi:predicted nuclease with TOPRIM domain